MPISQKRQSILFDSLAISGNEHVRSRSLLSSVHASQPPSPPSRSRSRVSFVTSPSDSPRSTASSSRLSKPLFLSPGSDSENAESPSSVTPSAANFPNSPPHNRRRTYAGDLTGATRELIVNYEERIALLEAHNSRMSIELEAAQGSLMDEREGRRIDRQSVIFLPPDAPTQTALDGHIDEQSNLFYERRLRMEILETLKKVRQQNSVLTRSAKEHEDRSDSLTSLLEAERSERKALEDELARLSKINFTLLEHNKLLAGRDSALQNDISTLLTKSQADDWMRGVLEAELRQARNGSTSSDGLSPLVPEATIAKSPALNFSFENQGPLRAQLVAARDELHVTTLRLAEAEQKCTELTGRISSLHQNMDLCVDSSAQALEVERELRAEVSERMSSLEVENGQLRSELEASRREVTVVKRLSAAPKEAPRRREFQQQQRVTDAPSSKRNSLVSGAESRLPHRDSLLDRHRRLSATRRLTTKYSFKLRGNPPAPPANFVFPALRKGSTMSPITPDSSTTLVSPPYMYRSTSPAPLSPQLTLYRVNPFRHSSDLSSCSHSTVPSQASTAVASILSPDSQPPRRKDNKDNGVSPLLAATLSPRKRPAFTTALKTGSTLFVDVSTTGSKNTAPKPPSPQSLPKSSRWSRKQYMMKRASAVLAGIAQTYPLPEQGDEHVV